MYGMTDGQMPVHSHTGTLHEVVGETYKGKMYENALVCRHHGTVKSQVDYPQFVDYCLWS